MDISNISYCPDDSKLSPKRSYADRINKGHSFERELRAVLFGYGVKTSPFGRALFTPEFQIGLNQLNDQTSRFLRYMPDLAGQLSNGGGCILIEAKSTLSRTKNYSINLTSFIYQRNLALKSDPCDLLRLLYIFRPIDVGEDYRAEWVQNLHRAVIRHVNDREILRKSRGSGSPYALVSGEKLRTLSEVLAELMDHNKTSCLRNEGSEGVQVKGLNGR